MRLDNPLSASHHDFAPANDCELVLIKLAFVALLSGTVWVPALLSGTVPVLFSFLERWIGGECFEIPNYKTRTLERSSIPLVHLLEWLPQGAAE